MRIKLRGTTTSTALADCKPCQARREAAMAAAEQITTARTAAPSSVTWSGPIVHEGQMTGDGRYIEANALTWDTLPIPLRWVREDTGEHNGAVVVGRITAISREPGGAIMAHGDFDTGSVEGVEAARQVRENLSRGISVDMDNVSFTVRVAQELVDDPDAVPGEVVAEADAEGRVTVLDIDADAEVMVIDDARIRAATLVAVPAFEGARIELDEVPGDDPDDGSGDEEDSTGEGTTADGEPCSCDPDDPNYDPDCDCEPADTDTEDGPPEDLVAAAAPQFPPSAWFTDPGLDAPTALTVTDDGRVFGHLALFDTCHQSFPNQCVQPPRSATSYAHFRTGAVLTDDGSEVPVGHITLDTLHAGAKLGAADTAAHYEHTGATVADVAAGEDDHGIWVAGSVRPNLSDDQLRALRSSPLSGDWRRIGGQLELVAALAVNVPGFPVPRPQGVLAASGAVRTLLASGMIIRAGQQIGRSGNSTGPHVGFEVRGDLGTGVWVHRNESDISEEALQYLQRLTARDHARLRAATLHRRVQATKLARRVRNVRS